jgi:hypothetical protein
VGHEVVEARHRHLGWAGRWWSEGRVRQDDRVQRIFAGQHAANHQPFGQDHRHVFAAVNGDIDLAAQQRVFDFLDEEPLSASARERGILQAITRGLDGDNAARGPADRGNASSDCLRLPQGQPAASSSKPNLSKHRSQRDDRGRCRSNSSTRDDGWSAVSDSETCVEGWSDSLKPKSRVNASA